jgi:CheY-like chemotaxis protein
MLRIILSDRGAVVQTAADVASALHLLSARPFDALISDIGMAGQDGYDLIREVRRGESSQPTPHARLPAIALTSFTREQDRAQALAAGFDAHCGKPLRPLNLVQQIRTLLDQRR